MNEVWVEVAAWLAGQADQTFDTSSAMVFLAGDVAWKIKQPVDFGFLDFSTLKRRKTAIARELDLNRRWSPGIYRAVRKVTRGATGFAFDREGEAVEWLLEMRRFDPDAVLANAPERLDADLAEQLGRLIARHHSEAPIAGEEDLGAYGYTVLDTAPLRRSTTILGEAAVERVIAGTGEGLASLTPLLEARRREGYMRRCHGDLHLGNILLEDGRPVPFDCIEFSDVLGRMDVIYDLAFPVMDLAACGRGEAANWLLNAYLDEAARGFPASLWSGLAALPQFMAVRAGVRAHVNAASGKAKAARRYLTAAEGFLSPPQARLMAIGGLSGVGKSFEARRRAALKPPGAAILRSDLIRKRLWRAGPLDALPTAAYAPEEDARVYGGMFDIAQRVLAAGWPVILDATFLDETQRAASEDVASRAGVPFEGLWLEAEPDVLRARVAARSGDASDAGVEVLERQLASNVGPVTWARLVIPPAREH